MNKNLLLICFVVIVASCKAVDHPSDAKAPDPCAIKTNGAPSSCEVSAPHLLASGQDFDGKTVSVTLYYPGYNASLLFSGEESADIHDLSSAFVFDRHRQVGERNLDDSPELSPGYYRVRGRFQQVEPLTVGEGVVMPLVVAGRLTEITQLEKIRTVREIQKECADIPGCKMNYLHGFYPIPTLEQRQGSGDAR